MDEGGFSTSAKSLYSQLGVDTAPVVVYVRRSAAFGADNRMIVGAIRRNPDEIQSWWEAMAGGREVVVYCVHGDEVIKERHWLCGAPGWMHTIWSSHEGELCSFDAFLKVYGIEDPAPDALAVIVRGADSARLEMPPSRPDFWPSHSAYRPSTPMTTRCSSAG
jgi:hypothetical protein